MFLLKSLTGLLGVLFSIGIVFASERHAASNAEGDLLDDNQKPVFLISTSIKSQIFEGNYEKVYADFRTFPKWLYGKGYAPAHYPLFEKIGFNALNFFGATLSYRVLAPDYKGFNKDSQMAEAQDFYRKYGFEKLGKGAQLPSEKAWREYNQLAANAGKKIPVYLDLHPGLQAKLTTKREVVKTLLPPEKYFAAPDAHPVFALRFKLCNQEARAMQKKLYVDQAQRYLALGIKPFVYKLYNEADYKDYSPENFRVFYSEIRKKYGTIESLNKAWHTKYPSFDALSKTPGGKAKKIEFRKFLERQIADFTGELRDAIRTVDAEAVVLSQVHRSGWLASWNNFNQYLINKHTGYVSVGTGNYSLDSGVDVDPAVPFGECSDNNSPREYLARAAFYRALADGKPILNTEAYIAGFGDRYRPFKKAFWHEMILGSSMMNLWEWGGFWNPWATPIVSFMLHHPKCVTPESWRAVPETLKEFSQTADFFQRRKNRPAADAAVLFSYPTLRANQPLTDGFIQGVNALQLRNIPVDAILEEQLKEKRQDRYRVILAFGTKNIYPETEKLLREFVEKGGILITDAISLRHDEFDVPAGTFLNQLKTIPGKNQLRNWNAKKLHFIDSTIFQGSEEWKSLSNYGGKMLMSEKKFGKGSVIAIAGTWQDCALSEFLAPVLEKLNLKPRAVVKQYETGTPVPYIGIHKGTHNGLTGWYFVNYTTRPQLVRVSADEFRNASAVNFIDGQSYPVDGDSVILLLPELYHTVMVTGEKNAVEKRFGRFASVTPATLKKEYEKQIGTLNKNAYVRPSASVDLRKFANYGFDNQQGWKTPSAWFDAGARDLTGVPWHGQVFKNVNFDLIRFDFNDNKTCIALKSKHLQEAPEKVENIPLNAKLRGVVFLHAVTHGKMGETAMTYRFTYEDGSQINVPIAVGREIGDWRIASNPEEIRKTCAWQTQSKRGFFQYEWNNPYPSKTLKSLSILSSGGESVPIVAAVSTLPTLFQKEYPNRLNLPKLMTKCDAEKAETGIQPDGTLRFNRNNFTIETPDASPIALPKEKINSAVLRFQLTVLTDEWGNLPSFDAYWWGTGLIGGSNGTKNLKTWPDQYLTKTAEAFVHAVRSVKNYSFPVEIEVPLKTMNMAGEKPFDFISGMKFAAGNGKNCLLIRDLRIEY